MNSECIDCGIDINELGCDVALPDQQWKVLCPEGGILCPNCLCKRSGKHGGTAVLGWIVNMVYPQVWA